MSSFGSIDMSQKIEAISISNNINLTVTVKEEPVVRMVKNGTLKLVEMIVEDSKSDTIKLTLFGNQGDGIVEGSRLQIVNANTNEFRGEISLSVPRWGKVTILADGDSN